MKTIINVLISALLVAVILYSLIGTSFNVERIKQMAPAEMDKRGWTILRYEGYQFGSWAHNGGKVWYHVCNKSNPSIQYRINVSLWNDELQFYYNAPETLNRINVTIPDSIH